MWDEKCGETEIVTSIFQILLVGGVRLWPGV